jgi:hypothetical protein
LRRLSSSDLNSRWRLAGGKHLPITFRASPPPSERLPSTFCIRGKASRRGQARFPRVGRRPRGRPERRVHGLEAICRAPSERPSGSELKPFMIPISSRRPPSGRAKHLPSTFRAPSEITEGHETVGCTLNPRADHQVTARSTSRHPRRPAIRERVRRIAGLPYGRMCERHGRRRLPLGRLCGRSLRVPRASCLLVERPVRPSLAGG